MSSEIVVNGIHYIAPKEAAPKVGLSADYVSRMCRDKLVDGKLVGGLWYVNEASLGNFLARQKQEEALRRASQAQLLKEERRRADRRARGTARLRRVPQAVLLATTVAMLLGTAALSLTTPITNSSPALAAVASAFPAPLRASLDRVATSVYNFVCPYFSDCNAQSTLVHATPGTASLSLTQPPATSVATAPASQQLRAHTAAAVPQRPQTIINQPIIERVVESVRTVVSGGVSEALLDARLLALNQDLTSRMNSLSLASTYQTNTVYNTVAQALRIEELTDLILHNPVIDGGSITAASITGTLSNAISSAAATIASLTATDLVATNATTTNLYVSGTATIGSGTGVLQSTSGAVSAITNGSAGQVLKIVAGVPQWSTDLTGGGGGGSSAWATTTDNLAVYPVTPSNVILVGASATTTTGNILEVVGNSLLRGTLTAYDTLTAPIFTATSTSATSTFPRLNVTGSLGIGSDYLTDITGSGLSIFSGALTVDTSGDWSGTLGGFTATQLLAGSFSTTSADYFLTQKTTDNLAQGSSNKYYSSLLFAADLAGTTTGALAEGSNLYWTNARFDTRLAATTTLPNITTLASLSLPATQLTNFGVPFYSFFSATTTNALAEGSSNKYFTDARADARINATSSIGTLTSAPSLGTVATSLSGFLKATAGVLSTALIDLANDVTGILAVTRGGTGWANIASAAIPYGNGAGALSTTTAGTPGQVLALLNGVPTWAATTTLSTITGTLDVSKGGTGATSFSYGLILSPGGATALTNIATSSLGLLTTHVAEGSSLYYQDARVQTYLDAVSKGFFFSTTSADVWKTERNFFSTTSATYFVDASTTIPKTYTANIFTGTNTFSSLTLGSLDGPLQANAGVLSATTSVGVLYGGTGLTSAPSYGQLLVGNSSSGYTLTATSSLGLQSILQGAQGQVAYFSGTNTTVGTSTLFVADTGKIGIGTVTPTSGKLHIQSSGNLTALHIEAPDVTSSSVFNITGPLSTGTDDGKAFAVTALGESLARGMVYTDGKYGIGPGYAIRDTFISRAATSTLLVSSNGSTGTANLLVTGNVGIGTTSPSQRLDVAGNVRSVEGAGSGVTAQSWAGNLVLDSDGSVGMAFLTTPGNATSIHFGDTDDNDVGQIQYLHATDVMHFNTNGSARLTINSSGNVGIASTSPWRKLSVTGTVGFDGLAGSTGAGSLCLDSNKQVVYNSGSDSCLSSTRDSKHDIQLLTLNALGMIEGLQPVSFVYNEGNDRTRFGFIAEDTAAIDPHLATYNASGTVSGIDDRAILSILVAALKGIATIGGAFKANLIAWLADGQNGITDLFAKNIHAENVSATEINATRKLWTGDLLCVGQTCITESQFIAVFGQSAAATAPTSVPTSPSNPSESTDEIPSPEVTDSGADQKPDLTNSAQPPHENSPPDASSAETPADDQPPAPLSDNAAPAQLPAPATDDPAPAPNDHAI